MIRQFFRACVYLLVLVVVFTLPLQLPAASLQNASAPISALEAESLNLHVLERLTFGPTPDAFSAIQAMGPQQFIQQQLHPEGISEDPALIRQLEKFSTLTQSPAQLMQTYGTLQKTVRQQSKTQQQRPQGKTVNTRVNELRHQLNTPIFDASQARILRAIHSKRQLQEVMTHFWFNHFNIYGRKNLDRFLVGSFETHAIRPHVLGRFRELLGATAHHPAMLIYLDNWQNTAPAASTTALKSPKNKPPRGLKQGLNENYARELMELHTLGVQGGYSQSDVVMLARILTGWGTPPHKKLLQYPSGFYFDTPRHDGARKTFLGHALSGEGVQEGEQALDILARHPVTARHLSYKLAQYFVNDAPPPALVEAMAQRYLQTDGNIREVLNTLFSSQAFLSGPYYGKRYKTPYRYLISSVRASGIRVQNAFPILSALTQMGMPLYGCVTPDGYKHTAEAWMGPDALAKRLEFATTFSRTGMMLNVPLPERQAYPNLAALMRQTRKFATNTQNPIDHNTLLQAYHRQFSSKTLQVIQHAPEDLRAALLMGSPERMYY